MKILVTGGHLTPALAVIDKLIQLKQNTNIVFVGRKYAIDSEKILSLEYKEIEKRRIKFIPLSAGRLTRAISFKSFQHILKVPVGFVRAFQIVKTEKPDMVLSFGGYLALPIALAAVIFRIPVYSHEQTITPGLANRLIARIARKVFISFEESRSYFKQRNIIVTGNPIRESTFKIIKTPFTIKKDRSVIYVTGGSLGSHSINNHIKNILPQLLSDFIIVHQTGDTKKYHDFEDLEKMRHNLPADLKSRYFPAKHFFEDEIGYIYSITDLVIGRSGANTFFELEALKKPAILIPLPWSANNEQMNHALIFQKRQMGEIFLQHDNSDKLLILIKHMFSKLDYYQNNFNKFKAVNKEDATVKIINQIFTDKQLGP